MKAGKTGAGKKSVFFALAGLGVLICLAVLRIVFCSGEPPFMMVGEYAVSQQEFAFYLDRNRALAASDLYSLYGIDLSADWEAWNKEYENGICPADYLEEQALADLRHDCAIRSLAAEYGVEAPGSWEESQSSWKRFQKDRDAKKDSRQIQYGPEQWDLEMYRSYAFRQAEDEIVAKISEELKEQDIEKKVEDWYAAYNQELEREGSPVRSYEEDKEWAWLRYAYETYQEELNRRVQEMKEGREETRAAGVRIEKGKGL